MLNITRLWCGVTTPGDHIRYGDRAHQGSTSPQFGVHQRPVVVWNSTRRCNLHCVHCYIAALDKPEPGELDTRQGMQLLDQIAEYTTPMLLISGGEPMSRPDLYPLLRYASSKGLRPGLSTNGTLITRQVARELREAGLAYVGISIDGPEAINDKFRGARGAFAQALEGIRNSLAEGFRVSLRFTLTGYNYSSLGEIFDLVERERIPRFCIYHLAYAGRGARIMDRAHLTAEETRDALDLCLERTERLHQRGLDTEVLTVDNHTDAAYLLLQVMGKRPQLLPTAMPLLLRNGGNASGVGISAVGPKGDVHADQFSHHRSFGNVKDRSFGAIWEDTSDPIMAGLKAKPRPLKGRCASCPALRLCNGNLRVRAETATGDPWAPDPCCYMSDAELRRVGEALHD
ncbi:MAG: radical SAM protein [Chloroflexi bacterium]|nr:radical SAM protein [Chloroflexota bacterium]